MDGFSNVTTVTVDDPLGNQLADAMDGLRCSRSTRAVQPSVVPQQTVRQQKVVEELADSMVSPFLPRNASTGGWGWPFPVWLGVRLRLATAAHVPHATMSPHRPTAPGRHPTPREPPQLLPPTSPSSPRMPPPPPQRTLDVHVDVYDADGRVRKPSAASRLLGSVSSPTAPWARRSTPVPPPSYPPASASPPPPPRLPCASCLRPSPRHHRCCGHHLSCLLARTTQVRKSRRLGTASALSRGSGPLHRLETAAPRVTRAAQAHAVSLAQQSRPSRGARGEGEGEEGEEEAQWQMGAVAVGADEGCAVTVGAPAELPQPSCRGASPPVRVH